MAFLLPIVAAGGVVAGTTYYNNRVLPIAASNYDDQFQETRKKGIMQSVTRADYTVWSPDANTPLNQPTQDALPGDVTTVQRNYTSDVTDMQAEDITYNLRARTGRIPVQCAGYNPLLVQTLNWSKTLNVVGGDTLAANPMVTSRRQRRGDERAIGPNIARLSGYSNTYDDWPKTDSIKSYLVDRRNPWAQGGQYVNITSRNDNPVTQSGILPQVAILDPSQGNPAMSKKVLGVQLRR